jgi:hypothetical protein
MEFIIEDIDLIIYIGIATKVYLDELKVRLLMQKLLLASNSTAIS